VSASNFPIAIIGAGFSGLIMALELKKVGIHSFTIYEAADELGGTWRDNTYPGCACDIPSHLYSLREVPLPTWSRLYSPGQEILNYMKELSRENDLDKHIVYKTEINQAHYDEALGSWTLGDKAGQEYQARAVIFGIGGLNVPNVPPIPGLEDFKGPLFHTTAWDHDLDLTGKRVAVIGTGASGIQIIPEIAPEVSELVIYQRTPPWIVPRFDRVHSGFEKLLFRWVPWLLRLYRLLLYWIREVRAYVFVSNPHLGWPEKLAGKFLRDSVPDEELREKLTPNYKLGCKRVLISDDYYSTLNRSNVTLHTEGIERITETGIVGADQEARPFDVIVMATGFKVFEKMFRFGAVGRDQLKLTSAWRDTVEAYFGMTVTGFPNFFILLGPNTALGHNSVLLMIEAQAKYIRQCIVRMRDKGLKSIEVDSKAQGQFNDWVQKRIASTVWMTGCQSWYLDESGRNSTIWPGYVFQYQWRTRRPNFNHFKEEAATAMPVS
jgi:cation diffusion facilitator CzcD-associated flavoprotein CzcO